MFYKQLLAFLALLTGFGTVVALFWWQELQYLKPTPMPQHLQNYQAVNPDVSFIDNLDSLPTCIYFFNPNCPCSRFNQQNFRKLYRSYQDKVRFYAIIENEFEGIDKYFDKQNIKIVLDTSKKVANELGVYATPQLVILDKKQKIYYKGNFNKSRYCTDPKTDFARLALETLLQEKPLPNFGWLASRAYGCSVFEEEKLSFWSTTLNFLETK